MFKKIFLCFALFLGLKSFANNLSEEKLQYELKNILGYNEIVVKIQNLDDGKKIVRLVSGINFKIIKDKLIEIKIDPKSIKKVAQKVIDFKQNDKLLIYEYYDNYFGRTAFLEKRFDEFLIKNGFNDIKTKVNMQDVYPSYPRDTICVMPPSPTFKYFYFMDKDFNIIIYSVKNLEHFQKEKVQNIIKTELLEWFSDESIIKLEFKFEKN